VKATQAYDRVTGGRPITEKTYAWINDLIERFGDEGVAGAIEAEGKAGDFDKLMGRVRNRLALAAQRGSVGVAPALLTGHDMLAIARGELAEPARPYRYDAGDLSVAEYRELLAAREERRGPVGGTAPLPWDGATVASGPGMTGGRGLDVIWGRNARTATTHHARDVSAATQKLEED
jgi:hypothetical protein